MHTIKPIYLSLSVRVFFPFLDHFFLSLTFLHNSAGVSRLAEETYCTGAPSPYISFKRRVFPFVTLCVLFCLFNVFVVCIFILSPLYNSFGISSLYSFGQYNQYNHTTNHTTNVYISLDH